MSGSLIGGVVGATIGFVASGFNPMGAVYGFSLGSMAGGLLLPTDMPKQYGPRLTDLRVQASEYGAPIPIVYGTVAIQGTVIWAGDLVEVASETETGGKGGPTQTTVNYSYFGNFAVALCEGPIAGVLRVWAGPEKRLIYDGITLEGGTMRVYLGDETQEPDPLIEADKGVGNVPAYRGTAYAVFENFPLEKDGNRLPFLTFEVSSTASGGACGVDYDLIGTAPNQLRMYDHPPVKLGQFDGTRSGGYTVTAADNDGNVYIAYEENDGVSGYTWAIKRVSATAPVSESVLYLGAAFDHIFDVSIAYNPLTHQLGVIQENTENFALIDCSTFTLASVSLLALAKRDIIYHDASGGFRFLDAQTEYITVGGVTVLSPDCYGISDLRFTGKLIDAGPHGLVVSQQAGTFLNGSPLSAIEYDFYDSTRDRLGTVAGWVWGIGYYDFATGTESIATDDPATRLSARYSPAHDRIICYGGGGVQVLNPEDYTVDCQLFAGRLAYADGSEVAEGGGQYAPVLLPSSSRKVVCVPVSGGPCDVFAFPIGVSGAGVSLASVVADLSERAGESRYDVGQLTDTVEGYVIARQTEVRAALEPLRTAYFFDAVESQGVIRFVKRGGDTVTTIPDDDLGARDAGGDGPEPLEVTRRMEVELPRAVTVKYLLAATDYSPAAKQARRLIGYSGDEQTVELPIVMSDTKAQEVAEVNLHCAWVERLSYRFTLPRKYSFLEPTDLVLVKGHLMRLVSVKATPSGVLQCDALADDTSYYAPHVVVTETPPIDKVIDRPGFTRLELF